MNLVVNIDWHPRRLLSWRVSTALDTNFCVEALEDAVQCFGAPRIFNTADGAQFTLEAFTGVPKKHGIEISNDWLTAAGFAPVFKSRPLDDPQMSQVSAAVRMMLANHAPFPAIAIDRAFRNVERDAR